MKRFYKFLSVLIVPSVLISYAWFPTGSPGGKTGSPGDGGATCISCHPGNPVTAQDGMITSDIPDLGYIPGETYTITATVTHEGITKAGFELTVENENGDKLGGLTVSDADRTHFAGNSTSAITHTDEGNVPDGNTNTWSMQWTAPETGSGPVTFYAAFNASVSKNFNIYTSSMSSSEQFTGVGDALLAEKVNVYPNPAKDYVNVQSPKGAEIRVVDMLGHEIFSKVYADQNERLDISRFDDGIYFIQVLLDGNAATMRFMKN